MSPSRSNDKLSSLINGDHASESCNSSSSPSLEAMSSTASSLSTLSTEMAGVRLTSSDPSFRRRNAEFPGANYTLCIAQRSGASSVKSVVSIMKQFLSEQEKTADEKEAPGSYPSGIRAALPLAECNALAFWARDPYYRVLISSHEGIPTIVRVMSMCPHHADFQTAGCTAIANLSINNGSNQRTAQAEGGLGVVVSALRNHPTSITVQSAACDALRQLISIVHSNIDELLQKNGDIVKLLEEAQNRVLPIQSRESVEIVLDSLSKKRNVSEILTN
uniref:Uncharacterized protein n=1 Tax=Ditylum brightwellii TaxID=49249 RepID=A0A6S9J1N7_9STRA|mmetsp:Transcript_25470/g.33788  ORF Transcript_25470/g.33788 Transcript_25470/m.33788 type:complete len:276 (-) Transcript_25470:329-1156(-)|eukprot:12145798-Ditylum_brightwellii.AAC.1